MKGCAGADHGTSWSARMGQLPKRATNGDHPRIRRYGFHGDMEGGIFSSNECRIESILVTRLPDNDLCGFDVNVA